MVDELTRMGVMEDAKFPIYIEALQIIWVAHPPFSGDGEGLYVCHICFLFFIEKRLPVLYHGWHRCIINESISWMPMTEDPLRK